MLPIRLHEAITTTSLSLKNVPDDVVERLRRQAADNHRSMQGELMSILIDAVGSGPQLTPAELLRQVRAMNLSTEATSAQHLREDRAGTRG